MWQPVGKHDSPTARNRTFLALSHKGGVYEPGATPLAVAIFQRECARLIKVTFCEEPTIDPLTRYLTYPQQSVR